MAKNRVEQYSEIIAILESCAMHIDRTSIGSLKDAELIRKIEDKVAELYIERKRLQACDD